MKPILFNTEMVRAILEGRKSATRRVVKGALKYCVMSHAGLVTSEKPIQVADGIIEACNAEIIKLPYRPNDTLYVRETWNFGYIETPDVEGSYDAWFEEWDWRTREQHRYLNTFSRFWYKADEDDVGYVSIPWRPSIYMPKDAARIFLRVKDVRVERLQDIDEDGAIAEGCSAGRFETTGGPWGVEDDPDEWTAREDFSHVWDSTIKYPYHPRYGWAANPWVFVIEFERCEKPERGREL